MAEIFYREFTIEGIPYYFDQDMEKPLPIPVQVLAEDLEVKKHELAAAMQRISEFEKVMQILVGPQEVATDSENVETPKPEETEVREEEPRVTFFGEPIH